MNRVYIVCLLMALLLSSCSGKKEGNTIISGVISDASGQKLELQELGLENSTTIDSVILDNEVKFSFTVKVNETGLYLLRLPKLPPLILELRPGDSITLSGSKKSFPADVIIAGSPASCDLLTFFNASALNKSRFDSIENILIAHQDDPDFAAFTLKLDESLKPLWDRQRALETNYIDSHPASLTSLLVLNHALRLSPVLSFSEDSLYYLRLDSSLSQAFPGNKHTVYHHKHIIQARELKQLKEGSR